MIRKASLALAIVALASASVDAALIGAFRQTGTGKSTNSLVYPGTFDTWVFEVQNTDPTGYDALALSFQSAGAFLATGSTTFKSGDANPVVFGFEAPDSFFVLPGGAVQLAASSADSANVLQAEYTTATAANLLPAGSTTIVAAFSVPAGTQLTAPAAGGGNYVTGNAVFAGGPLVPIVTIPEPATLGLLGLAFVGGLGFLRRR